MILPVLCGAGWDEEAHETLLGKFGVSNHFLKLRGLLIEWLTAWLEVLESLPLQASVNSAGIDPVGHRTFQLCHAEQLVLSAALWFCLEA